MELHLLANEVHNIDGLPVTSDLDVCWEMRIHKLHAVFEALGHAINHVLDVTAGCLDDRQLLGLSEPLLDLDGLLVWHAQVHRHVPEALGERATWASHFDHTGLHLDGNTVGNLNLGLGVHKIKL